MKRVVVTNHDDWFEEIHHLVDEANQAQRVLAFDRQRLNDTEKDSLAASPLDASEALHAVGAIRARGPSPDGILVAVIGGNLQDERDDEYFFCAEGADAVVSTYHLNPDSTFMRKGAAWWASASAAERDRIASGSVELTLLGAVSALVAGVPTHSATRGCVMDLCEQPAHIEKALHDGLAFCDACRALLERTEEGKAILAIAARLRSHPLPRLAPGSGEYDVLLLYGEADRASVHDAAASLRDRGVRSWPEVEQLGPGVPPPAPLPDPVDRAQAVAVFVGAAGGGPWTDPAVDALLEQAARRERRVLVVLCPGARERPALPPSLAGAGIVDLGVRGNDPIGDLVGQLRGEPSDGGGASRPPPPRRSRPRLAIAGAAGLAAAVALAVGLFSAPGIERLRRAWHGEPAVDPESATSKGFAVAIPTQADVSRFRARRDRALLVATNRYRGKPWSDRPLEFPVADAKRMAAALEARGFAAELLVGPTYQQFTDALDHYARMTWDPYDQLVLFISGHGNLSEDWSAGQLVLADSAAPNANYVFLTLLRDRVDKLPCRHVLVIVDVCHAGSFLPPAREPDLRALRLRGGSSLLPEEAAAAKLLRNSRRFLSAVGDGPTPDSSAFLNALVKSLGEERGDGYLTDLSLFTSVQGVRPSPVHSAFGGDDGSSERAVVLGPLRAP